MNKITNIENFLDSGRDSIVVSEPVQDRYSNRFGHVQVRKPMEVNQKNLDDFHKNHTDGKPETYYNILTELHNQGRITESQMWDYQESKGLPIK